MLLIDTNVLVYAVSPAEAERQARARSVLTDLMRQREAALAVQNCAEFLQVAAIRRDSPLELSDAVDQLRVWCRHMTVFSPDYGTVEMAVEGVERYQISFWDAMIWAIAVQNGLEEILSEDGPSGATLRGVRWTNPFEESGSA